MTSRLAVLVGLWLAVTPIAGAAPVPVSPAAPAAEAPAGSRSPDSPAALLELNDDELLQWVQTDPGLLGSLSIGIPRSSILFNGVQLPASPHWEAAANADTWATAETVASIEAAVETVYEVYPDTPPITIGDMSAKEGGRLKRHTSHQGGRDVDFGFYYKDGRTPWFSRANARNLDLGRNWTFVRALITRTDVETILLDTRVQRVLYQYALSIGEDKQWLDRIFGFARGSREALIVHVAGHQTHYHVRFYNAVAQELGRRAQPLLVQCGVMAPPVYTIQHVVKPGQTIGRIASLYGTSVRAIQSANGLRSTQLRAGRSLRIPRRGAAAPTTGPIVVPHRLLPPTTPEVLTTVEWPTAEALYPTPAELDR